MEKETRKGPTIQDSDMTAAILELLHDRGPTMTSDIQSAFGINNSRISRRLKDMEAKGILVMNRSGSYEARIYSLTDRGTTLLGLMRAVRSIDPPVRGSPVPEGRNIDTSCESFDRMNDILMGLCGLQGAPTPQYSYRT